MMWLPLLFVLSLARAEMIFLDLNNADKEIKACQDGIEDKKKKSGQHDDVHVIKGLKGERDNKSNTYWALREQIKSLLARKVRIDSIVISGEDGTGNFFGSTGDFDYRELQALSEEFPELKSSLTSAALWGCYTTNVNGTEQYWLNRMPGMKFTMGFTMQGPDKYKEGNHQLLKQFCGRRQEAVNATSKDQLCSFYDGLQQLVSTSVGLCIKTRDNTNIYAGQGYAKGNEKCFTTKELYERCGEYIRNDKGLDVYREYLSGEKEPGATEPPDLRKAYNTNQLWRHCVKQFKTQRGTDMPYPPNMIRLIKQYYVKKNLAELNAKELASYDQALERAGLKELALGDITKLPRKTMNQKIQAAIAALNGQTVQVPVTEAKREAQKKRGLSGGFVFDFDEEQAAPVAPPSAPKYVRGVKDPTLKRMAECMRMTFVQMEEDCSPFGTVNERARPTDRSECLFSYDRAKVVKDDDPC